MPEIETADVDRCEVCGRPCGEVNGGREELRMELTRDDDGDLLYWAGDFCSQEHAAEWLHRPLPEPLTPPRAPGPTTWGDRLAMGGCLGLFLVLLALFGLGVWTAVQYLVDRT